MQKCNALYFLCAALMCSGRMNAMHEAQPATETQNAPFEIPLPQFLVDLQSQTIELDTQHAQWLACDWADEALFSPSETFFLTVSRYPDGASIVNLWNTATHIGSILCVDSCRLRILHFSPDSADVFIEKEISQGKIIEQWHLATGIRQQVISREMYNNLVASWPRENFLTGLRPFTYNFCGSVRAAPIIISPNDRYALILGKSPKIFDLSTIQRQPESP